MFISLSATVLMPSTAPQQIITVSQGHHLTGKSSEGQPGVQSGQASQWNEPQQREDISDGVWMTRGCVGFEEQLVG